MLAPGENQTHDLKTSALQASALPQSYNSCPTKGMSFTDWSTSSPVRTHSEDSRRGRHLETLENLKQRWRQKFWTTWKKSFFNPGSREQLKLQTCNWGTFYTGRIFMDLGNTLFPNRVWKKKIIVALDVISTIIISTAFLCRRVTEVQIVKV